MKVSMSLKYFIKLDNKYLCLYCVSQYAWASRDFKTKMLPKMLQLFQLLHNIYADQNQFSKDGGTMVRKEKWKA